MNYKHEITVSHDHHGVPFKEKWKFPSKVGEPAKLTLYEEQALINPIGTSEVDTEDVPERAIEALVDKLHDEISEREAYISHFSDPSTDLPEANNE